MVVLSGRSEATSRGAMQCRREVAQKATGKILLSVEGARHNLVVLANTAWTSGVGPAGADIVGRMPLALTADGRKHVEARLLLGFAIARKDRWDTADLRAVAGTAHDEEVGRYEACSWADPAGLWDIVKVRPLVQALGIAGVEGRSRSLAGRGKHSGYHSHVAGVVEEEGSCIAGIAVVAVLASGVL